MTELAAELISRLEQEFAFLVRALEAMARKRGYPMERAHYLLLLRLQDGARSVGDLANELALDASTVTRQIGAMERRNLVRKLANPADRRSALVEATPQGLVQTEAMRAARLERMEAMFGDWDEADQNKLAEMLSRVNGDLKVNLLAVEGRGEGGAARDLQED